MDWEREKGKNPHRMVTEVEKQADVDELQQLLPANTGQHTILWAAHNL